MKPTLTKGDRGSIAELRVATHLMGLGFYVARNLSVNGPFDLIAVYKRRVLLVQVKSTLSLNSFKVMRQGNTELLACLVGGEIHYKAISRRVQKLVPGSLLARRPKRRPRK